jgi:hypothetical protein
MVRLDLFQLLGLDKPPDTRWDIAPLFYSRRGPGFVTDFHTSGTGAFGFPGRYDTTIRGHLQYDYADTDILGNLRKPNVPNELRGLAVLRHRQELDEHWSLQSQIHYQSDRNFYEQWWKHEFDEDLNQETYLQLKYQREQFALSGLFKPSIRNWMNEGSAIPRADGWIVGQDLFRTFSLFTHASAGFYRFNTTSDLGPAYFATPFPATGRCRPRATCRTATRSTSPASTSSTSWTCRCRSAPSTSRPTGCSTPRTTPTT